MTGRRADVLTLEARARLARAVARAEAGTSGEIVVMVSRRAGAYRSVILLATLAAALLLPWPLIALTAWSAASILLAQAALVAAILVASQNERLRMALVPRQLRRARAREAARRAFWSRGLSLTRRRTGVLLYLSLAERHAEIVTDLGVLREIPPTAWDGILAELVPALGRGAVEDGLTAAVERVGACLAEHLPAEPGDPDELPNRVVVVD
ncbi:TPM domain-containing protein [Methylobacterium sp. 391_Methyba4]|uniref:TPM domain-containing protein n=1 Tax=Methylobacterium sp. 391_Methyba4 TaxID=3038924 RepID=UPI00241F21AB|nr:TPM domain-containing protein [Methylobacterium sp. 391_Methyba4]WFS06111.1 TPM domain-containing protein [Methylobacterium sp. 391_Methyba4]